MSPVSVYCTHDLGRRMIDVLVSFELFYAQKLLARLKFSCVVEACQYDLSAFVYFLGFN